MDAEDENRRQWQQLQNQARPGWNPNELGYNQWPPKQVTQPAPSPGYSPLSEADVQRIAIAVVARLELLRVRDVG